MTDNTQPSRREPERGRRAPRASLRDLRFTALSEGLNHEEIASGGMAAPVRREVDRAVAERTHAPDPPPALERIRKRQRASQITAKMRRSPPPPSPLGSSFRRPTL